MIPEKVFHYTKASVALEKILFDKRLKIGSLRYTNDPRESREYFFDDYISPPYEEGECFELYIKLSQIATRIKLDEWRVLCFSKHHPDVVSNKMPKWKINPFLKGTHRPTMWAHYAENHVGVCLTFNVEQLDELIKNAIRGKNCEIFPERDMNYEDFNEAIIQAVNTDEVLSLSDKELEMWVRQYFKDNYKAIFLKKFKDWQHEWEYRWVVHSEEDLPEIYVPIGDALKEVTVGCNFSAAYYPSLFKFCEELGCRGYRMTWYNGTPDRKPIFPPKK